MSTSSISSTTPIYQPSPQNGMQQNFQALAQAVQAGNLSAAQQAYATLTQNMPQGAPSANGAADPFQQAISSIGGALQSGDMSGAQGSLQTLQQGMKSHHGHRHHAAPQQGPSGSVAPTSTAISTASSAANTLDISA